MQSIARILLRCGRYLNGLKLGSPCHYTILPFVATHCPNLIRLDISLASEGLETPNVVPVLKRLEYLHMININDSGDDVLSALPCETLRELHLHGDEESYDRYSKGRPSLPYSFDDVGITCQESR